MKKRTRLDGGFIYVFEVRSYSEMKLRAIDYRSVIIYTIFYVSHRCLNS